MLLVNDPNAALVGSLRPRPENALVAALREGLGGPARQDAGASLEEPARLRSRAPFWVAGGLLAGVIVLMGAVAHELSAGAAARVAVAEPVAAPSRAGSTVLTRHVAPAPVAQVVAPVVSAPSAPSATPVASASSASSASAVAPRAAAPSARARGRLQKAGKSAKKPGGPRAYENWLAPSRVAAR